MKYLSVCSGIEAATVAWHGLGWEPVAFAEIEAFPAAVLAQHYPTVPNLGDLTKYREWPEELLVEVELLVGGTPCQAFSVAGQRRSLDDERGNLSLTYVNLFHHINEVRKRYGRSPAIALWENVPGVLSTKDNAFGCFIGGLLGCDEAPATESGKWDKAGFLSSETVRVGYRVLDAQYFGVAQRRRRVFLAAVPCELVGRFGERACPSEILSLRESVLGNPPTRGAAWEGVARATAAGTASRGRGVERPGESRGQDDVVIAERIAVDTYNQTLSDTSIPVRVGNAKDSLPAVLAAPPVCGTLSDGAHMGGGLTGRTHTPAESCPSVARTLTQRMHKGFDSTLDSQTPIVTQGGVFDSEPVVFHPTQDDESWVPGEIAPTQNQFDQGDTRATTVVAFNGYQRTEQQVTWPIQASDSRKVEVGVRNAMQVRRLCPSECEALQGFPIGYTDVTYRKKPPADGPRYRALGNSMAVPCMWWLGKRIHEATQCD